MQTNELRQMIKGSSGKFFFVEFVKRTTGEVRKMVARLGVQKNIVGTGLKFNPRNRDLMVAWDVQKNGYRMINLRGMRRYSCGNRNWRAA